MHKLNALDITALLLTIIGALNWGLIGIFNYNLVADLFGDRSALARVIYTLVGLSGLYLLAMASNYGRRGSTATTT